MSAQWLDDRIGKHRYPVFIALATADQDLALIEIDILDPQAHAFHQTHARTVEQASHQTVQPLHQRQQTTRLVDR